MTLSHDTCCRIIGKFTFRSLLFGNDLIIGLTIVSRGDWLGNPANFKGTFCCFGFDVEMHHHVTMTLHSLFQSKMADGADFLNGDDLEAILDILEADKEMEEEFINEDENVSTRNTIITYYFGERERKMTRKPEHLNTNV